MSDDTGLRVRWRPTGEYASPPEQETSAGESMAFQEAMAQWAAHLEGKRLGVLTGAGMSTDSGIPDYRGPGTRRRARNPIQFRAFMADPLARQRYWARATVGWGRFSDAAPNAGHRALAAMQERGVVTGLVTQNVDRLHTRAGSKGVVELHGALAEVVCMQCGDLSPRVALQARLAARNEGWAARRAELAPDGDADLEDTRDFQVVDCDRCGGFLKPHVVFFGESVPSARVEAAWRIFSESDVLLVLGSSLAVYSGYRFVRRAQERGVAQVAIVGLGATRGDRHATWALDAPLTPTLRWLEANLPSL